MAFSFYKALDGRGFPEILTVPSTASEVYTDGEALVLASGAATKCGATVVPTHICAVNYSAPASGNAEIAVYPVLAAYLWETTLQAAGTALKPGDKVTLHTDGEQITATTTSGVATIVSMGGTAVGSRVVVKF